MLKAQSSNLKAQSPKPKAPALLSSTYFGPVQWYQKLNRYGHCLIEQHDHFIKQTYRNRCVIATAQGLQSLTVPVESPQGLRIDKTEMRDIRVSDHGAWRHLHWQALTSAYGESPFFEFYADDIRPFFEKYWTFLLDFNLAITEKMCELLDIRPNISLTTEYQPAPSLSPPRQGGEQPPQHDSFIEAPAPRPDGAGTVVRSAVLVDYRAAIRPKYPLPDPTFTPKSYYQVFSQKFGFQPNLSILDLLFNMGNEAVLYL